MGMLFMDAPLVGYSTHVLDSETGNLSQENAPKTHSLQPLYVFPIKLATWLELVTPSTGISGSHGRKMHFFRHCEYLQRSP